MDAKYWGADLLASYLLTHYSTYCWRRRKYTIDDGQIYVLLLNSMSCCCYHRKYWSKWTIIMIQQDISYVPALLRQQLQLGVTKIEGFVCACEYTGVVERAPKAKICVPRPKSVKCDEMFYSLFFLKVSYTQHLKDATLQGFWSFFWGGNVRVFKVCCSFPFQLPHFGGQLSISISDFHPL